MKISPRKITTKEMWSNLVHKFKGKGLKVHQNKTGKIIAISRYEDSTTEKTK